MTPITPRCTRPPRTNRLGIRYSTSRSGRATASSASTSATTCSSNRTGGVMPHIASGPILQPLTALGRISLVLLALVAAGRAVASDHADPIVNNRLEAGITDLFAFPTTKDGLWRIKKAMMDGK